MRIASGILRNMPISCPPGIDTRPTPDKIRQAVLNSISTHLSGAHVLDLFAGTGAMGLEAVSRGAKSAFFVDSERGAISSLKQNIQEARRRFAAQKLDDPMLRVCTGRLPESLIEIAETAPFDLIWLDPPYSETMRLFKAMLPALICRLNLGGILVLESELKDQPLIQETAQTYANNITIKKSRSYGRTGVTLWSKIS